MTERTSLFDPDRSADRTPVTVVTGFLGSGKTTLVNRLLRDPDLADTAVIVNELGAIAIDHALVESVREEIVVLKSGCVCCSLRSDLETALRSLLARRDTGDVPPFRRIVIETTGLADPAPIMQLLLANPLLVHFCTLARVVATVDAVFGERQLAERWEARKQAVLADTLLVTKRDLAPHGARSLATALRALNPRARIADCDGGCVDSALVLPSADRSPERALRESEHALDEWLAPHASSHGDIDSIAIVRASPLDWLAVQQWLAGLRARYGPQLLRVKGVLDLDGEDAPVVVHGVHHVFHPPVRLRAWTSERRSQLVFITAGLDPRVIAASFDAAFGRA